MKFVYTIYILIVVFAENVEKLLVRCFANFKEAELNYLSQKLNLFECLQLVKTVYEITPKRIIHAEERIKSLNEDFSHLPTTSKMCLFNLELWNNDFPRNANPGCRSTMEISLRWLGRPDLAKYVRERRRPVKYSDREYYNTPDALEFPEHKVLKRQVHNNKQSSSIKGKKKKKKRHRDKQSQSSGIRNKRIHNAVAAATGHVAVHKSHQLKKKENHSRKQKNYIEQHRSVFCSIMFVLLFITLCLVAVYFLRRQYQSKTPGTRFKYKWNTKKEDKDTFTDDFEWNDEDICSCSDLEGGFLGKCSTCSRNYQTRDVQIHRNASDNFIKTLNSDCVQKQKKKKKKKKQRFSIFQSFQDKKKEKDQENQDRKKILEKNVTKKHEKVPIMFPGEYPQCACCKCNSSSREKMLREKRENEKRELQKLKKKKRKMEKRRKKEEIQRAKYPNVCFKDTCK